MRMGLAVVLCASTTACSASSVFAAAAFSNGQLEAMAAATIREDRASAVRDGVFTDRVHVKVRSGVGVADVMRVAGGIEVASGNGGVELDGVARLVRKWGVRLTWLTIDPPAANRELAARLGMDRLLTLWVPEGTDVRAMAQEAAALTDVFEAADVDYNATAHTPMVNDAQFGQQWHLNNTGQVIDGQSGIVGADTRILNAWTLAASAVSMTPITVAVLDTGVSMSHPDLQPILVPGQNTVSPSTPTATDDNASTSHGTYCAGIAGAIQNNTIGVAGISPNVRIMPIKVLQSISLGSQSACANGLTWATDRGARVASMSLGWTNLSRTGGLDLSVMYAAAQNVVMCSSTGNSPGSTIGFPAKLPEAIAIGGTNNRDLSWAGGTTGAELDMVAPASGVLTTCDDSNGLDGYVRQDGTSMACPMVAAAAALVLGVNPLLTGAQVRTILMDNADDLGSPGWDPTFGAGRLNVERAIRSALLSKPCRADMDNSGALTIDDVFTFVGFFFAGDQRADFDANLTISVDDLFIFLTAWFQGGC